MNPSRSLRIALLGNAAFSSFCGLGMLVWPEFVDRLLGIEAPWLWSWIGVGLLAFATDLVHQATRKRPATWRALYASAGDFLWVIGTLVLLVFFFDRFSKSGAATVLIVAGTVLVFGAWQLWGMDRAHRGKDPKMRRHCLVVRTEASASAMWAVIARMGDIQHYAPSLVKSEILNGKEPGVGAVRRCTDRSGKSWSEACVDFQPGRSFTVRFVSEEPDFPFPARTMVGGWQVESVGAGSEVTVWWELDPKPRFLAPVLLPVLAFGADRDFAGVIRRMSEDATGRKRVGVRLLPRFC